MSKTREKERPGPATFAGLAEGEGEMTDDTTAKPHEPLSPLETVDAAFLITASELRDRKTKRRRKGDLPGNSEAIRRLVELGLKAKK